MKRTFLLLLFCFILGILPPEPACAPQPVKTVYVFVHPTETIQKETPLPVSVETPAVSITTDGIPMADYTYQCDPQPGDVCVDDPTQLPEEVIARAVYLEGGGLDFGVAVDLVQLLQNRMQVAWECGASCMSIAWRGINPEGRKFATLTSFERIRLAFFVMSERYQGRGAGIYSAWNNWNAAFPKKKIDGNPVLAGQYRKILGMVREWVATGGTPTISANYAIFTPLPALVKNKNVIYAYAAYGKNIVWLDARSAGFRHFETVVNGVWIYYSSFPFQE
jgi:hypothetical protein